LWGGRRGQQDEALGERRAMGEWARCRPGDRATLHEAGRAVAQTSYLLTPPHADAERCGRCGVKHVPCRTPRAWRTVAVTSALSSPCADHRENACVGARRFRRRFFRRASGNPTAPPFKGTGDPGGKTMDEPDDRSRPRGDVSDTTDTRCRPAWRGWFRAHRGCPLVLPGRGRHRRRRPVPSLGRRVHRRRAGRATRPPEAHRRHGPLTRTGTPCTASLPAPATATTLVRPRASEAVAGPHASGWGITPRGPHTPSPGRWPTPVPPPAASR
jgi:hypothetical protein